MSLPTHYEFHKPILEYIRDGRDYNMKSIRDEMVKKFSITESETREMLPSGRQTRLMNRIYWAKAYLKHAGLIDGTRNFFHITQEGLNVLKENPKIIDQRYLLQFKAFRDFVGVSENDNSPENVKNVEENPDDIFEEAFQKINDALAEDILNEVIKVSPAVFEQMVIDLLSKMGYGAFENAGKVTAVSGDEGIDGVIMEDKLGFSLIYIQAKRWDTDKSVGRPEIQGFVGAIAGKGGKGLFVTTAKFSKQAVDYANRQHIILIDGIKLAKLMIEYNFGVTVRKTFEIKSIDTDLFNEYQDE